MEVAAKRVLFLSGVVAIFGVFARLQPHTTPPWRTEGWMEDHLPTTCGNFEMVASKEDPKISYRMEPSVYKALSPYGIVARVFQGDGRKFDTVVLATNDRISLHDPHVCFPGQDWTISSERQFSLPTKLRGIVHAMILDLRGKDGLQLKALYTFRGPSGTFAIRDELFWDWFVEELKGKRPDGSLMRVMTLDPSTTQEQLSAFASQWFDETYRLSDRYF